MKANNRHNLEVRVQQTEMSSNGDMLVSGYVNMTNTLSYELGFVDRFVEKIAPGAFSKAIARALSEGEDIDFLAEHDDSLVLASTKNATLKLNEDEKGLFMEAKIINTGTGRDYYEMIKSGIVTNMSFGFYALEDTWKFIEDDLYERTVTDLELFEVSAVRRPAYAASTISSRGLDIAKDEVPENIKEEIGMENKTNDANLIDVVSELRNTVSMLTEAVKEMRGTKGVDVDGNEVSVQKDNYAVGQKTAEQDGVKPGEVGPSHKVIKEGEPLTKYANDDEIDDKGSYNHDTKVPNSQDGKVTNKPESESGVVAKFDGSKPSDVPGDQNDYIEKEVKEKSEDVEASRSYSLFREEFQELRGGNK